VPGEQQLESITNNHVLGCIDCIDIGKSDASGSHPAGVNAMVSASPLDEGAKVREGMLIPAATSCTHKTLIPDTFDAFHDDLFNGINGHKVLAAGNLSVVVLFTRKSVVVQKPLGTSSCKNVRQLNVAESSSKFLARKVEIKLREGDIMVRCMLSRLLSGRWSGFGSTQMTVFLTAVGVSST